MNYVVAIVGLLVGAQGFWSVIQLVFNRKGQKAEISRQESVIEIDKEKAKTELVSAEMQRDKLLAESRLEAQQNALDSWEASYSRLHLDYVECERKYVSCKDELIELHEVATTLIDVFAAFVARMRNAADSSTDVMMLKVTGDEFLTLRRAISNARLRLK